MNIAIQEHPTRGKEVIQILESLGGSIPKFKHKGGLNGMYYYINDLGHITLSWTKHQLVNYKFYTLEQFEKEFPFKVGDKVIFKNATSQFVYTISALKNYNNTLGYELEGVPRCKYVSNVLELYKPMKEERNITLTLDKAKEWYKQGGELREIALQAFTENELKPQLPRSWEEYCKGYKVPAMVFGPCIPNKYVALWKLEQLRDCYRNSHPDKIETRDTTYGISRFYSNLSVIEGTRYQRFLSFQTKELANKFLSHFESLIKEAGDLI